MPPIPSNERWAARLNWLGFWLFDVTIKGITLIFLVGDVLMTSRLLFIGIFAVFDRLRERHYGGPGEAESYKPDVAVLIPAYNEEKVIERTIRAALGSHYPNLRVIVIDDGSSDRTLEIARETVIAQRASDRVLILTKPNSGKAEALNF
jgi:cellulose synthase/poly-beta-1,6-N-acetylglucosamine synthase-like glycosyltransferase